jgi:hypothetical protein
VTSARLVIAGGPRTGKTTLARALGSGRMAHAIVRHTDDLIATHDWSAASEAVSLWFDEPGPWIVEGVATPRALRKWLQRRSSMSPCDAVVWLAYPWDVLDPGQERMRKGCLTVMAAIQPELERRGVRSVQAVDPRNVMAALEGLFG